MSDFGGDWLRVPLGSLLGIRPGMNVHVVGAPPSFMDTLLPLPEGAALIDSSKTGIDLTVLFAHTKVAVVEKLTTLTRGMAVTGAIWVVFPAAGVSPQAPTEEFIRLAAIEVGLTDTKKLLLGPEWSALRLQWRPRAPRAEPQRAQA